MENFVNLIERNRVPDMAKSWKPLIPYKFPKLLTPETLKTTVLESDEIKRICKFYSNGNDRNEHKLRKVVKVILEEIGFKRNMSVIRFLGSTLNKVLLQMTSGVYVNQHAIINVKRELSKSRCPVLYLPSHRSYADFVLMSWICFDNDLEIPAIAAGMDFHAMVGMGNMLRNTGAFFMRRSFSSDKMYWDVFREYVRTLITKYHSGVEFFLEGTRSRSCKALPPKIGLLSMLLEPFFMRKIFDVLVIPVAVSYDRPVEEELFAYELLGVPKPKESTSGLFKAFDIMDTNHGQIFVNFGTPMSIFDYFESNRSVYWCPNKPQSQILTKDRLQAIGSLATTIVDKQQKLYVLNTFNLISVYFNYRSMSDKFCNREELKYGIELLANFLKKFDALLSCDIPSTKVSNIIDSLEIHSNILKFASDQSNAPLQLVPRPYIANATNIIPNKLKGHLLSASTMQRSLPSILLQTYQNPCMYWLHQPAFYLLARKMNVSKENLAIEVQRMKQIFQNEFCTSNIGTFNESIVMWERFNIIDNDETLANLILASIVPFVFCYFNIVKVMLKLSQCGTTFWTENELYIQVQMHVEAQLNANSDHMHPYCLSLDSIGNALHSFVSNKYLIKKSTLINNNKTVINYHVTTQLSEIDAMLTEMAEQLRQFNGLANYLPKTENEVYRRIPCKM